MRIAAIYDIHGNPSALEAVLHDINKKQVDCIVVGGDVVAGPLPIETLALLQQITLPTHFILGNAESDVLMHIMGKEINGLSERANEVARWVARRLSPENQQFLSSWVPTVQLKTDEQGHVLFCHGTPYNNSEIFTKLTSNEKLTVIFGNLSASVVVCGHTHMQFDRSIGKIRIVNAGSVGMPFGKAGADWLLIDKEISFNHTNYDLNKASERIRQSDYPYADDFAKNNVLNPPSEKKMLEMLTRMETEQTKKRP